MSVNTRHYNSADPLPPLKAGSLRIYNMKYCPFAQRSLLVLHHKGIKHEVVNVNLGDKPAWFIERNPNGTVPTLEQDGKVLFESTVVMDYLDDAYPDAKLTPTDPYVKAKARITAEEFSKVPRPYFMALKSTAENKDANISALNAAIEKFEKLMPNTRFMTGDKVSMLDYVCWPFFERIPVIKELHQADVITTARCPKLHAWVAAMGETPGVKGTRISIEEHMVFFKDGDYDFMLKK